MATDYTHDTLFIYGITWAYKVFDFEWDNENKWDKYITWTGGKYLLPYKYIHRIDEFKSSGVTNIHIPKRF